MDSGFPGWAARHALFAPWGILATTYALTAYVKAIGWNIWSDRANLVTMSDMVDLGIAAYAAGASLAEVIVRMVFYALEQRKKRIEQRKREMEEMRTRAIQEGRQEGIQAGLQRGIQEGREETLRMFSRDLILKSNENPQASVEELVKAVASEMEMAERN